MHGSERHERRFHGGADRLRAPGRIALLETARVVGLCREGLAVASVLDVGTGTGVFAEAFARENLQVSGVDPDKDLLDHARRIVPGARFVEGVAEALPFPDRAFDLVFLGHVLHETDDPVLALTEGRRAARLRVAILEWPYRTEEMGPPLEHRLPPARVFELAREAGLRSVERIELAHMDFYRASF